MLRLHHVKEEKERKKTSFYSQLIEFIDRLYKGTKAKRQHQVPAHSLGTQLTPEVQRSLEDKKQQRCS